MYSLRPGCLPSRGHRPAAARGYVGESHRLGWYQNSHHSHCHATRAGRDQFRLMVSPLIVGSFHYGSLAIFS